MSYPSSAPPGLQKVRRYDLDWLRSAVFAVLILNHVAMYYNSGWWFVKSPAATTAVDPYTYLTLPWRLLLLFVISGAATAFILTKSKVQFLQQRSRRLLVPLVFAMLFIIPPQMYYAAVEQAGYTGGYLQFWGNYLLAARKFCTPVDCFDAPTWSHLWFVAYLWSYTVIVWAVASWRPQWLEFTRRLTVLSMRGGGSLLWPILVLVCLRLWLRDLYPPNMSFVGDWYRHAVFMVGFAFGFLVVQEQAVWRSLQAARWVAVAGWFMTFLVLWWLTKVHGAELPTEAAARSTHHVAFAISQWCGVVMLLGFASRAGLHDSATRRYITEGIFPFYIVHQTAIIAISQALKVWALPAVFEALLLTTGTVGICVLTFEVVRRVFWLRPLFGLRSQ